MWNNVPPNGFPQLNGGGSGDISEIEAAVEALETTVGDSESGLVKDVADLETTVGDSESGLVKDVADLNDANKYLTSEMLVGKWGASNLYRKYINIGALPNSTSASYNTGLTTETIRRIEFYYDSDDEFGAIWSQLGSVSYNKSTKKIDVSTQINMSDYNGIVILEYTK